MSPTPEEVLNAIKDYRPPKKLHPIAGKTYDLYAAAGKQLTPEALDIILEELRSHYGDLKATTDALAGLASFQIYAREHLDDEKAADQIMELMKDARMQFEPLSLQVAGWLSDLTKKLTGIFDRFTDRDRSGDSRAPVHDKAPPEGTVPLKQLKPMAEPPRVRRRDKKK
jgi:hypothetical protein